MWRAEALCVIGTADKKSSLWNEDDEKGKPLVKQQEDRLSGTRVGHLRALEPDWLVRAVRVDLAAVCVGRYCSGENSTVHCMCAVGCACVCFGLM